MLQKSNPEILDSLRYGDDLLARIFELNAGTVVLGNDGNGWRFLLFACSREIRHLRGVLRNIGQHVQDVETGNMQSYKIVGGTQANDG